MFKTFGLVEFMDHPNPVFVLHLYPTGMMITRDPSVVEEHRRRDLIDYGPREPNTFNKFVPVTVAPRNIALDFIRTDRIAQFLLQRNQPQKAYYLTPCTNWCGPHCAIELAGWIQLLLNKDVASIVGEYLLGKGWPGESPDIPFFELLRAEYCVSRAVPFSLAFTAFHHACRCCLCR